MQFRASGFFGFAGSFIALAILSATELIPFALALQQTSEGGLQAPGLQLREKQPDESVDKEAAAETDALSDDEQVGRDLGPGLMIEAALEPIDSPTAEVQIEEPTTDAETTVEDEPGGLRVIEETEQVEDVGEEQLSDEIPELTAPAVKAEAAKFNGIQPGTSVSADVVMAWGDPDKTIDVADGAVLVYAMKPFDRIEVTLVDDVVASILIYLGRPFDLVALTERLKLGHIAAVDVVDDDGATLGRSFPELGVLFSFVPGGRSRQVAQIFIESIDAEPFVLRVKSNLRGRYSRNLRDLEFAIGLDPDRAETHWLAAQMLLAVGEVSRAEKAAARAVKLEDKTEYRLTWAESLARQGKHDQAVRETLAVLEAQNLSPVVKARGLVQLGDLVTSDDARDYGAALDLHI
ncbi:MAG: hypothetical protein V3V75_02345, partial [Thermoguttaceae bacterium]